MVKYMIPRNIQVKEQIALGLNARQIIYVGLGVAGAVGAFTLPFPIDLRIVTGVLSSACGVAFSLAKRHGQDLDKYILNSAIYPLRNKEWVNNVQTERVIQIRFNARKSNPVQGVLVTSHEGTKL